MAERAALGTTVGPTGGPNGRAGGPRRRRPSRSATSTSTTTSPMPCRASTSPWTRGSTRWSDETAWARRPCATRSWGSSRCGGARSASRGETSPGSPPTGSPRGASPTPPRDGACGRTSPWTSTCASPGAAAARGPWSGCTTCSRGLPSGGATEAGSSRAASSRCSPSRAPSSRTRGCWCSTSRPRGSPPSSSPSSRSCSRPSRPRATSPSSSSNRTSGSRRPSPKTSRSWSTAGSAASFRPASWPPTVPSSSACSGWGETSPKTTKTTKTTATAVPTGRRAGRGTVPEPGTGGWRRGSGHGRRDGARPLAGGKPALPGGRRLPNAFSRARPPGSAGILARADVGGSSTLPGSHSRRRQRRGGRIGVRPAAPRLRATDPMVAGGLGRGARPGREPGREPGHRPGRGGERRGIAGVAGGGPFRDARHGRTAAGTARRTRYPAGERSLHPARAPLPGARRPPPRPR